MKSRFSLRVTLLVIAALAAVLGVVAAQPPVQPPNIAGLGAGDAPGHKCCEGKHGLRNGSAPMTHSPTTDPVNSPSSAATVKPIKVPNPPEDEEAGKVLPETPKVGSRDAPGG